MAAITIRSPRLMTTIDSPFTLFDELASELWSASPTPTLDIYEQKDELVVKADLPGVKKDSIDITVDGEMLNIRAERKDTLPEDAASYICERMEGQYQRHVYLPFEVDFEKASSHYEDGVLEIRLPKAMEARTRKIEVK